MIRNILKFFYVYFLVQVTSNNLINKNNYNLNNFKEYFQLQDDLYSGYIPINNNNNKEEENKEGNFFFLLSKQRKNKNKKNEKLIIWLNGGPGCTSLLGAFYENGPFNLKGMNNGTYNLVTNPFSWNEVAHTVFVEQPIRTGFSQASTSAKSTKSESQIAYDFRGFLSSFLDVFSEFKDIPIYLSGESYAGFYIPWIAEHILKEQEKDEQLDPKDRKYNHVNLQGVAIGNGAIDVILQTPSYTSFSYNRGLIPLEAKYRIDRAWQQCLGNAQSNPESMTKGYFDDCGIMELVLDAAGKPNEYNTATFRSYDDVLLPNGPFHTFMNDVNIQRMLHVRGGNKENPLPGINFEPSDETGKFDEETGEFIPNRWKACNDKISESMRHDHPISSVPAIKYIVNKIRVLLYSGEFDLNCNFLGTQETLQNNLWNGRQWKEASRSLYKYENDVKGENYKLDNLQFLIIRNSGHLLPMDQPSVALDMIDRFIHDESFDDFPLPSEDQYQNAEIPNVFKESSSSFSSSNLNTIEQTQQINSWNGILFSLILLVLIGGIVYFVYKQKSNYGYYSNVPSVEVLPITSTQKQSIMNYQKN